MISPSVFEVIMQKRVLGHESSRAVRPGTVRPGIAVVPQDDPFHTAAVTAPPSAMSCPGSAKTAQNDEVTQSIAPI
jgi:hypothetical protein